MLTTTADGLPDDDGWVFRPHERGWMAIPLGDVALDMPDQSADGVERATANRLAREDAEPGLDHVEPGGALGGEVKLDLRMLGEPGLHRRRRMRGRVIEDDVQFAAAVAPRHPREEAQEIGPGVPRCAVAEHAAARDLQRRIQARQAVAPIVVSLSGRQPGTQRQQRLGTTQRLDLRLLVEPE